MRCAILIGSIFTSAMAQVQQQSVSQILRRNYEASGGAAWLGRSTLKLQYSYSGQGLTGKTLSVFDTHSGAFIDTYDTPPVPGASGFDGAHPWMKDISGAITPESGGDKLRLAINQAYRNANAWWRADRASAIVKNARTASEGGRSFEVLQVTPKGGKQFEAWFDSQTSLLARIVEMQGFQTITTTYENYQRAKGVLLPHKIVIDDGSGPEGLQKETLMSATFSAAHPTSYYAHKPQVPNDFNIEHGAGETTVSFELLNDHIYVPVFVDGNGPFRFILDSGGHDILVPHTAAALNLKIVGLAPSFGAGEGSTTSGYTRIHELRIGAARLTNQVVGVEQFQPASVEGFDQDGMLGFELFRRFVVHIDYRNKKLTLTQPTAFHSICGAPALRFVFYDHIPQVHGAFMQWAGTFDLDTGSRVPLTLTKPFVEEHQLREHFPRGVVAVNGWGVGGPTKSYVTRAPELRLGSVIIPDVITSFAIGNKGAFADPSYEGNVGTALLKRFDVTFDYRHQIVHLQPLVAPVSDIAVFDRSGTWINGEDTYFTVMDVTANGPADKAGLRVGDKIVTVDGVPARGIDLSHFRQMLRDGEVGTVLRLDIKRGKDTQEIRLTLGDQI